MSLSFSSSSCYEMREQEQEYWGRGISVSTDGWLTISLDGVFFVIALCQAALSILVVTRRSAYRPAFVALTFAIIATIFSLAFDIAEGSFYSTVASAWTRQVVDMRVYFGMAQNVAQCFAEILAFASAFLAMRSRQSFPTGSPSRLETICWRLKYSVDAGILATLLVISIIGTFAFYSSSVYLDVNFGLVLRVLYGLAVFDLTVTVWYLRSHVAKSVGHRDQVIDSLACLVSPLLATNMLASMAMIGECDNSVWTFSLIEKGMVPALTFTIFLSLGLSPSVWKSDEDEGKQRWSS